ncbi:hybrid sensor histidine kinase/response regulator [Bordetella genomosp. 8]|uniref:Virulence sensor protein BvgS n=1 Tax=Bordetella genomosp. 8 TaxID=1416806 RepID=A0A1W6YG61_9BORD|nr:ATP-binding protein [Bordetella genomosp. 8]ARP80031.1 hybrid sensor histidine kinase/response regulator [Bordetella genomosp. 8]
MDAGAPQRIVKIRRDYNTWVANETLEDYALRFTPLSFRKWSEFRVANTAIGALSFLALEAIGGTLALNYGFVNAFWAIVAVAVLVFFTGLPIAYYAARHGLDMDLLTRGAGFGYIGSTITSLIYASFTFIFFALEAAIMALAIEVCTGLPLWLGYMACAIVIIPLVTYGITLVNRLQSWTQPVWLLLLVLPYAFILYKDPDALRGLMDFAGRHGGTGAGRPGGFDLLMFGAGAAVAASLITQIGEQVDFLRFLPEKTAANRARWWTALLCAGPGWIVPGAAKMLGGAFLAWLALEHGIPAAKAADPTKMYLHAFGYVFANPGLALAAMTLFVVISQVKINVTNAYAGSLAWSNFFARITHSHPGRVVWLVFNVLIAIGLMEMGVFDALEHVLAVFAHVAIAWIGSLVADLVINKPLGLSPRGIEFRRAYLYDINPVGVGGMLISMAIAFTAYSGVAGAAAQALSPFITLLAAFIAAPAIAWATRGRYYLARQPQDLRAHGAGLTCVICAKPFEAQDMAHCPAYNGAICSLCCTLDARCQDRCKTEARLQDQLGAALRRILPGAATPLFHNRLAHYLVVIGMIGGLFAAILALIYYQEAVTFGQVGADTTVLRATFLKLFAALLLVGGVAAWWLVLTNESRQVAQEESDRQTNLLLHEIEAHRQTDAQLQKAKEAAEAANLAKSRFMGGMSHELRAPLNSILGYAQILQRDAAIPPPRREAIDVIHRSGKHLIGLIDGLLDIARIEAGKLRLENAELRLPEFLEQIVKMFQPQTALKGLRFDYEVATNLPKIVHIDEKRLRQILINLMSNAVKFTRIGHVALRVRYAADMVQMEVEDSGAGIPPEDLERIFMPFERSWAAADQADTGTGLGLTICRMLTGIMGGELTVRSEVGRGSAFTLKLFLPEVRSPRSDMRPAGAIVGYAGERRAVLVVDDQPSQRRILRDMLEPLGFDVLEAGNGQECLACVHTLRPALILMDVSMPGLAGWEVCRLLRDQGVGVPVIIVSANAYGVDPKEAVQCGLTDWLVKPVVLEELLAKIGLHLRLEWIVRPAATPAQPTADALRGVALDREDAESLLELGAMGYIKGIFARLDEIRARAPHTAPLIDHLAALAQDFRLAEYNALLKEHLQHHVAAVR